MHHSLNSCYSYFSFIISSMFFLLFLFFIFTLFFRDLFLFILGSSSYPSLLQYSPFSAPSSLSLHSYFSFLLSVYFSYPTLKAFLVSLFFVLSIINGGPTTPVLVLDRPKPWSTGQQHTRMGVVRWQSDCDFWKAPWASHLLCFFL